MLLLGNVEINVSVFCRSKDMCNEVMEMKHSLSTYFFAEYFILRKYLHFMMTG